MRIGPGGVEELFLFHKLAGPFHQMPEHKKGLVLKVCIREIRQAPANTGPRA